MRPWKIWLASASVALAAASCALFAPIEDDRFRCGEFDGDTVRVCDGVGEVCVCTLHRCAVQAWGHCDSGFRFRFPTVTESLGDPDASVPLDCVPAEVLRPMVSIDVPGPYCPGEDPRQPLNCGVPDHDGGYVGCPSGQLCVCGTNPRCAVQDRTCADEGSAPLRYVSSWSCAGDLGGADAGTLVPRDDGSCPGQAPYDLFPDDLFPDGG